MDYSTTLNTDLQQQTMSVADWMITILIAAIPIVGFVMLFVWGFGNNTNQNKANWAKASLIWIGIVFALYFLLALLWGTALLASMS